MRTTKETAEQTRKAILDAALEMFAERGWAATTFAELGATIGMTRGAVHHHFRDKEDLLRTTLREQWQVWSEPVLAPLHAGGEPEAAVAAFVEGYLRLLAGDPRFRALTVVTTQVAPGSAPAHHAPDHAASLGIWREALHQCLTGARRGRGRGRAEHPGVFVVVNFLVGATLTAAVEPDLLPGTADARRIAAELARATVALAAGRRR